MLNDLRYAIRMLIKSPGFTAVTVATLAIVIGATTAIFSAAQTTILSPVPVRNADRLMKIESFNSGQRLAHWGISLNTIDQLRQHPEIFTDVVMHEPTLVRFHGGEFMEMIRGAEVSPDFFGLWGVQPAQGRTFAADEGRAGADRVVVLSTGFWKTRLGGDPAIIGKTVELAPEAQSQYARYTVIGVMPAHFVFPEREIDYWIPQADPRMDPKFRSLSVSFRLADGATASQAQAILDAVSARDEVDDAQFNAGWKMQMRPVRTLFADESTRQKLWTLTMVMGLVWLIACANVATLLLARSEARQYEMATRAALGAGRGRMIRQLMTESLLLALAGGLCGLLLTNWGIAALSGFLEGIRLKPMLVDGTVLLEAISVATATGIAFGLIPAWRGSNPRLLESLKQSGSTSTQSFGARWLFGGLIISEIALAIVVLACAGLMIHSVSNVLKTDLGYDPSRLIMAVAVPSEDDEKAYAAFVNRLGDRYAQLPGMQNVGIRTVGSRQEYVADSTGRLTTIREEGSGLGDRNLFAALAVPLIKGRFLERSDLDRATVVINQTLARTLWPGKSAIGMRLRTTATAGYRNRDVEVVGVVGDVRLDDYETEPEPTLYLPAHKFYGRLHYDRFYLRAALPPASMMRSIQTAIREANPGVIDRTVQDVSAELYRSTQGRRFFTLYLTLFAAVALLLAIIGLYGLMSYSVQRRIREFGIRMALGSTPARIQALTIGAGLRLACIGLAAGLLGATLGTGFLQSQLYGISAADPPTFIAISMLLSVVALLACWLPARRAARLDPMTALRSE